MKKAASLHAAGTEHSTQADSQIVASEKLCDPSDYLRVRPPFRCFEVERQWANYTALAQLERYLTALSWYRHRLEDAL